LPFNQSQITRKQDVQTACSRDLDLESMTLIYKRDLNILKMHPHTKNELSIGQEHCRQTDRHTDTQTDATDNITTPYSRVVTIIIIYLFIKQIHKSMTGDTTWTGPTRLVQRLQWP